MVEISKAFEYEHFTAFDRKRFPKVPINAIKFAASDACFLLHCQKENTPALILLLV